MKVSQDHYVPADLILLSVNGNNGTSYIETKNLDGETNLKIKTVHPDLRHLFENEKVFLLENIKKGSKFICIVRRKSSYFRI